MVNFKIEQIRLILNTLLTEWDTFFNRLKNYKEEELEDDIFSELDFLIEIDEVPFLVALHITELKKGMEELKEIDKRTLDQGQKADLALIEEEAKKVLDDIEPSLEKAQENLGEIAKEILLLSEIRAQELVNAVLEHRQSAADTLQGQVNLISDEENELRDLRDSLENYKEIRLEHAQDEESDTILQTINSQIIECDMALLIDESSL